MSINKKQLLQIARLSNLVANATSSDERVKREIEFHLFLDSILEKEENISISEERAEEIRRVTRDFVESYSVEGHNPMTTAEYKEKLWSSKTTKESEASLNHDSVGAMAAAWFGTPGTSTAVEKVFGEKQVNAREIKNNLAIDGTIDNAFKAAIGAEPDALHAVLVELAHASVDATIEALKDKK